MSCTKQTNEQPDKTGASEIVELSHSDAIIPYLRRDLALIVTGLVVIVAIVASFQIGAMPVLDKILPLVTLLLGFFFGPRVSKL